MARVLSRLPAALARGSRPAILPLQAQAWAPLGARPRSFSAVPLRFSDTHEWIRVEEPGVGTVGISEFAQGKLGEVQAVGLPKVGTSFKAKAEMVSIESIKTISSANAVSDCEVIEVNTRLEDEPTLINESPFDEGWIVKVKYSGDIAEFTMDKDTYEKGVEDGSIPE
mmetsp:Transcript_63168/g.184662  ORF Transcript_63168/g.184662 Transcript_63168/m.184662 type:complete len:168 (-) Transcript_63168:127-630(-)